MNRWWMRSMACAILFFAQLAVAQQSVRTIFLVRHAEKASNAADAPLSAAGEKRADCLARMLKEAGIKEIYVTDVKRTQQTAAPLAKALGITPTILPAKDSNALIRDLFYGKGGNVLVVGHSDTLPFVIARLNAGTISAIGDNEYDRLFLIASTQGVAAPVTTLRYCDCGAAPATTPSTKTGKTAKKPAPKMKR